MALCLNDPFIREGAFCVVDTLSEREHKKGGLLLKKQLLAAFMIAIATALSGWTIPIGAAKLFPIQHVCNVIMATTIGMRWSVFGAFGSSLLRNMLGLGTPLAFPGSMVGAACAAWIYRKTGKNHWAAVAEVFGTGILGGLLAYPVAAWVLGKEVALVAFVVPFTLSSCAGAILGWLVTSVLQHRTQYQ